MLISYFSIYVNFDLILKHVFFMDIFIGGSRRLPISLRVNLKLYVNPIIALYIINSTI